MKFMGYRRKDSSIGVRNHILILAVDECCDGIARAIAEEVPGTIVVTNYNTCMYGGNEEIVNTMIESAKNPNVFGALVISMGCGSIENELLVKPIKASGRKVESFIVREAKGTKRSIELGQKLVKNMREEADSMQLSEGDISELVIGVKCGGSDTSSGLASNPSVGKAADLIIDNGGTVVVGELIELITCEKLLEERVVSKEVSEKLIKLIEEESDRWHVEGTDVETMSIGNSVGGLTTLEEKALGALCKTGSKPILDVLKIDKNGIEKPKKKGLYLSEVTHLCGGAGMQFSAIGTHMVLWTTGSAGFNNAIVPVIRVSGNENHINEDIDIDATGIMRAEVKVEDIAKTILNKVVEVARGEKTAVEGVGYSYCTLYQKDQRLEQLLKKPKCC